MTYDHPSIRGLLSRIGIAVASVAGAVLIRLPFAPLLGYHIPLVTFPLAVLVAGYFGGLVSGLLATALGLVGAEYFFLAPAYSLKWPSPADAIGLSLFTVVGIATSLICEALCRARIHAELNAKALHHSEEALRQAHGGLERQIEARTLDLAKINEILQKEIAERNQAEKALRESEERFRTAFEHGAIAMALTAPDSNLLKVNPAFCKMLGYSEAELVGRSFKDISHPDDMAENYAGLRRLLSEPIPSFCMEKRYIHKGGQVVWGSLCTALVRDAQGQPLYLVTHVQDITERKRAEEALGVREEQLRQAVRVSNLGIFDHDQRAGTTQWSPKMREICGWKATDDIDLPALLEQVHPEDRERIAIAIERAHDPAGDGIYAVEHRFMRTDGVMRWLSVRSQTFFETESGRRQPVRTIGVTLDITERKQAEEAIRDSEERLRRAQEIAHLGSWELDLVQNRLIWSDEVYRIFGLQPQKFEATYEAFLEWVHPDDRNAVDQAYSGSLREGRDTYEIEHRIVRKDTGEIRFVHEKCEHFRNAAGCIIRSMGMVHDITERKLAEESLRTANAALAEAAQRKDEFLAMLSHELRNPLAPVRTAVQVLRVAGPRDPVLARQRDIIDRQINHMARLVDDLLDVSRITRGRIELKKQTLHLADVMVRAVELASPLIETRRQQFSLALPPDDMCVEADPDRLTQAIGNLLSNAAKYTQEDGEILLEASRVSEEAVIRVRDTGVGIAPEVLPHIFELFVQADQGLARAQGGLGIGLTVVKKLVEMHGGRVEAHSDGPGKGSEFVIRLPALSEREQASVSTQQSGEGLPEALPHRILVVDDIVDTADSLIEVLSLAGHETRVAYDGPAALKMVSEFMPDVVILDIGMPGMDGYEVARRMRKQKAGKNALLVALTGYAEEHDRQLAHQAGFNHHLSKPVNLEMLHGLLAQPLARP